VSGKVPLYTCLLLCEVLTDFKISFTDIHQILSEFFSFQQDSDPAHRAHEAINFLICNFTRCWSI